MTSYAFTRLLFLPVWKDEEVAGVLVAGEAEARLRIMSYLEDEHWKELWGGLEEKFEQMKLEGEGVVSVMFVRSDKEMQIELKDEQDLP